jgi:DNA-binding NarL/FixJ family response regulator
MLCIVIADDHPVVPKGLKEIILESFDNAPCRQNLNTRILLKKVRII